MYWTRFGVTSNGLMRAQMDGSNVAQLLGGLRTPSGITIDYDGSRIFWTEHWGDKISSSNLDGTDVRIIVTPKPCSSPWGIALHKNRMYWSDWSYYTLQRSSKSGQDVRTLFTGTGYIQQVTTTSRNFPTSRQNHCEGQNCSSICILTTSSFRCVP